MCDGTLAEVVTSKSCTVDNYDFNEAPFSLPWGSSIYAKVIAINVKGGSVESLAGNGAIILRAPDAPLSLADVSAVTNNE